MVFSEPRKIRPKKKSVLFSRRLKSGCRNIGSFRRPFLLDFCRVDNFFDMFFLLDQFPQVVTLDGSGVPSVVAGPVTLAKVSGRGCALVLPSVLL